MKIFYPATPFVNNGPGVYPPHQQHQQPIFVSQYNPYNPNMNNLQSGFNLQPNQMNNISTPVYNPPQTSSYGPNNNAPRSQPLAQDLDFPQPVISESVFNTLNNNGNNNNSNLPTTSSNKNNDYIP